MKIAILGWGSLLWDTRPEFDEHHGDWLYDGPELKLEFSRISESRGGALTLVIDEANGAPCTVAYTMSSRQNPVDAICDLKCREGTTKKNIAVHFVDGSRQYEEKTADTVNKWAAEKGLDVVVWTGLPSKFKQEFSLDQAMSYLQSLEPENKRKAAEYIRRAPDFVDTLLRRAVQAEPWFQEN